MKYFITCLYCGEKREMPFCKKDRNFCKQKHYWLYKKGQPSKKKGKKYHRVIHSASFPKGHTPWNKNSKGLMKAWNKNKKYSLPNRRDENSSAWKSDQVGYMALHQWVNRKLGKAFFCINGHISKRYVWANISGEYKRELSDWHSLCTSCNMHDGIKIAKRFIKSNQIYA